MTDTGRTKRLLGARATALPKKMYSKDCLVDTSKYSDFFESDKIPKLTESQKQSCKSIITDSELYDTLKSFSKTRSPRLDGLTTELY